MRWEIPFYYFIILVRKHFISLINQKETKVKDKIGMHLFLIDLRGLKTTFVCANDQLQLQFNMFECEKSNATMSQLHNDDAIKVFVHLNRKTFFKRMQIKHLCLYDNKFKSNHQE